MASTLDIRLLGTSSLAYGGQPLAGLNTPRLQSLLAYLVLHSVSPLLRQHLAFLFWPDTSEAQARNNLRQALHALRQALPAAETYLQADTNTLWWQPNAPFTLDVAEFEQKLALAEAAHQQRNVGAERAALEQAAALYRGDLLPICYDAWIAPERDRLRQRAVQALDQLIQLLEREHDFPAAIDYARRVIRQDPLDENAYRCLMRLLALTGDRAGALRAYQTCVTTLRQELGVSPSPETEEAHARLLRMEGAGTSPARPRPSPATATALIGRRAEWQRLHEAWQRAITSGPAFVLVSGEAGIGKSRLAEELALWAEQRGAVAARARCYAAEGRLSLAPVTDWLRGEALAPHLARLDPVWLAEVARILPELASRYPELPHYEAIGEYGQRQRFFEALARALLTARAPLLLLIDDLQWCDQETLEWLHYLVRYDPTAPLLVLGTARAEELSPRHPLSALVLHLRNTIGLTEIALEPFDAAETARLAATIARRELQPAAVMHLYRETEGNPLFVVETMRAGFDPAPEPAEPTPGAGGGNDMALPGILPVLPPKVQAVIAGRLAHLSPPARELTALAAAIGRAFRVDVLVRAGNDAEDAVVRALDELWQRHIVREQDANTYDFAHDKLREVAYGEISAPHRRLLHRRIAQALEALHVGDLDPVSGQIASHYERASLPEQAIPYYQRAAAMAQRIYANADAASLLSRCLALLEHLPAGPQRDARELSIQLALASIYLVTRGWTAPELEQATDRSLVLCDRVGDDSLRVDALCWRQALLVVQARLEEVWRVQAEMQPLLERTQRAAPPLSGMTLAGALLHHGHFARADAAFEAMITTTVRADDLQQAPSWNYAIHDRAWQAHGLWCLGYPERAISRGLAALQLARDRSQPFNQALASTYLAMLQQLCADPATARARAEEALALTQDFAVPYYRAWSSILVRYARAQEQPDEAQLAHLREAIEDFKATRARLRLPYYLWLLASVCAQAGRVEEGLAAIAEALAESQTHDERWWDAELHRLRGELLLAAGGDADESEGEAALLRAREIAQGQEARSLELRACLSLARLWRERGRDDDARRLLGDALGWFTEGFDTPDLLAAQTLLETLRTSA